MKKNICFNIALLLCCAAVTGCMHSENRNEPNQATVTDLSEQMKKSLVYLEVSKSSYELSQPWKRRPISKKSGYGCAVGPYEILTTAENVINATHVQVRAYSKNAYIAATVKIVDYEYNLCLLELDKDAMDAPLTPLLFKESYPKREQIAAYWLSSGNHLTTARSTLDRAEMRSSYISFVKNLTFIASNVSRPFGDGQICCYENDAIGIAAWGSESDSGIIPSETINRFLTAYREKGYARFATSGFSASALLDPAVRSYLKIPEEIKHGVYVSDVYTIGTGSKELKQGDVILSINGHRLNPYGRYEHPEYERITYHHILLQTPAGNKLPFEIIRDGKITTLDIVSRSIESDNMLIPGYIYDKQPEYKVIGGYVFQKLSRDYLAMWGQNAPPHLNHYKRNFSFKPSDERKDMVILSYVLPAEINLGYQQLSRMVVDSVNGTKIKSMKHFVEVVNNTDGNGVIKITFEMDSPVLIIPKEQLKAANTQIAQSYGIPKMMHVEE